ncbi:UDP-N-acetylglucosamine--N-acetylmuramyl-(pentapeptide) pyrophosphoryl-undecaprenol N-acetylglucosamine transferase [Pelagibacterales bacterium SAG-MED20]|nr:UDP-N-acetylglucosamine--N-acetylmuramyl-(pentapeptide) pyrophosphoryl-undecaprenol N-acetylglucosamine transferase [Pelagibacterales bacterium SAG-MED20]
MKNILISTGGSGGHVIPALILYEHLKEKYNVFISSDNRGIKFLDKDKDEDFIKIINVPKIKKNIFLIPFQAILLLTLIFKSLFFLKKKKIEIVISTGGYMSLPLCVASKVFNIRLFLFEPNMVLGRTNKLFLSSCTKVLCYSDKIKKFPDKLKDKIFLIPPLLRKEFYQTKISTTIEEKINLLIIGGSQGASLFDNLIKDTILDISKKYKLKVFHQTGLNNYNSLKDFYLKNEIDNELFDFNEKISNFMSRSNICITRAGASTLAELTFLNIPYIAIPLPSAKDNHQLENALFYYKLGCNWILNQNEITTTNLTSELLNIIENKEDCLEKIKKMKNFNYQNTWNNINQKIITIIDEN